MDRFLAPAATHAVGQDRSPGQHINLLASDRSRSTAAIARGPSAATGSDQRLMRDNLISGVVGGVVGGEAAAG
jgi:hypothetical protein